MKKPNIKNTFFSSLILICILMPLIFQTKVFGQLVPSIQWQKSFGGIGYDRARSVKQTVDGGYIVAGSSDFYGGIVTNNYGFDDYWVVKLTPEGQVQWQKNYGGSRSDIARSIQQTSDGGYIIAGSSGSNDSDVNGNHGGLDYWVIKITYNGAIQWQKSLGGSGDDEAYSIQQTSDGGYVIAGYSISNDGDVTGHHGNGMFTNDYWIVKLNSTGSIQWQQSLGGNGDDMAQSIEQTLDGGYIVAGSSDSNDGDVSGNNDNSYDYWVVKLNGNGVIQWQNCYGGILDDWAKSIQQTNDGGYIVAGYSITDGDDGRSSHGDFDFWIIKLTNDGIIQWHKSLGGSSADRALCIQQTSEGGYVVAGYSNSTDGDVGSTHYLFDLNDYWVVKLDNNGLIQWHKYLGGSLDDLCYSVQQTTDGGYILAGSTSSNDGDAVGNPGGYDNYWIVKLGAVSLPLKLIKFEGQRQHNNAILNFTTDNEINTDKFIIQRSGKGQYFDYIGTVKANATPGRHVYSYTDSAIALSSNYYRLKIQDKDGSYNYSNIIKIDNNSINFSADISPNPSAGTSLLTLSGNVLPATVIIADLNGKILWQQKISNGTRTMQLPTANYAAGVYMITVNDGTNIKTLKLVKR